ncbi:rRNA pseudouridine synthase [Patescibacteria group bacterium]|nr:rRNA pseudouridine synthase [Patescibacteria group bacterium]MBU1759168.1 rRNA pseudouridine synthase [Patescibacteria group bacterium]MBU1906608.1 rRNA pseudouridine synthase [Patescibacteria group bacterium]
MRINKYLTTANYCSRREADRLIEAGKVKINGKRAKLGDQVEEGDRVEVPGQVVELEAEPVYLAFNKPVGVITTSDPNSRNNIINAVNSPVRVYPVGRLDVATSGLIIMTNDGELVNKVLKAENKIEKEYLVEVDQKLTPEFLDHLRHGMNLGGRKKTLPARVEKINDRQFSITIVEGRKRQVRRMCERGGYEARGLSRVRIGNLKLGNLLPGKSKKIAKNKIYHLLGLK